MEKKGRGVVIVIAVLFVMLACVGIVALLYVRMNEAKRTEGFDMYGLVPESSAAILDVDDIVGFTRSINDLNSSKDNHTLYLSRLFVHVRNHINGILEDAPHGLSRQMRKLLISFHEPDNPDNQVYYCRLGAGDIELVEKFIKNYSTSPFPSKYFEYRGREIRIYPMPDDSFIACYFNSGFLAMSFQKRLIEEVIDAQIDGSSILSDELFRRIYNKRKSPAMTTVYLRLQALSTGKTDGENLSVIDVGAWTEFDMKWNSDFIYFTGINHDTDTCASFMNVLRAQDAIDGFPGEMLPATTFLFTKSSISDLPRLSAFTAQYTYARTSCSDFVIDQDRELSGFLNDYAQHSITSCRFMPRDSIRQPAAVAAIPLKNAREAEHLWKKMLRTAPWENRNPHTPGSIYVETALGVQRFYAMPQNTLFSQLTGITVPELYSYSCFHQGNLLLASDIRSLSAYIDALERGDVLEENIIYQESISTLSDSYNFLMMIDMQYALYQPDDYTRFIPNFFFRHREFFSHFVLSVQFTCVDNVIYPNIILLYKG